MTTGNVVLDFITIIGNVFEWVWDQPWYIGIPIFMFVAYLKSVGDNTKTSSNNDNTNDIVKSYKEIINNNDDYKKGKVVYRA